MNNILSWIRHHRLQAPTIILLESYRPLSFMVGQVLLAAEPLLPGAKTSRLGQAMSEWEMSDPKRVDDVIAGLLEGDSAKVS